MYIYVRSKLTNDVDVRTYAPIHVLRAYCIALPRSRNHFSITCLNAKFKPPHKKA